MANASSLQALLNRFTHDTRLIRLTTPLGTGLLAESVRGEEALSAGFSFRVEALSTDAHIELKKLLGQPVLLQLLTTDAGRLRPFHGHITSIELSGANGGFARYILGIEPWTAFLNIGRDSRTFQNMDVVDILDTVFAKFQGVGKLAPAWRFELADRSVYPKRSLTTQYQESDFAFAQRLMHEEGLFYFFEHTGDPSSPRLGSHTMVIADNNGAFKANVQAAVSFTQPGSVMKADSIDRWRTEIRQLTSDIQLTAWDYRTIATRDAYASSANSGAAPLASRDAPGVYAYGSREHGQRLADNQIEAIEAARKVHVGAGTVRTLAPGTTFTLSGHARFDTGRHDDDRTFLVTRTVHMMHNNLSAELLGGITELLGKGPVTLAGAADRSLHAVGRSISERPLYRNRIDAIHASVPYRTLGTDGSGRLLHPRPTVRGQQTAIVVGPPGSAVHTDRDHRIKVQFHWQRGAASHSRRDHPAPEGHTGAPADDTAGTWVRVMTPVAGANWGSNFVPRVGQEVLVDFLDGDIDRPVVIGCLYNGRGQADAQHIQVCQGGGAATGNAAAWFPGEGGGHAHPAVLSGFKSQAMQASQIGGGAYSQLVFDDSPGQARVALQRHGKAHDGSAELNLGHLRHQSDNQRLAAVGFGAELKTAHGAALRAGQGMLLSTDKRGEASGGHLDSKEAHAQTDGSYEMQVKMAGLTQKHNARLKDEPEPDRLATVAETKLSADANRPDQCDGQGGGKGAAGGYVDPQLQLSSPGGILASTPEHALWSAGVCSNLSAGQDINLTSLGNYYNTARAGVSIFTYGKSTNKDKPNQELGIRLHAASGKICSQSQSGVTTVTADKAITVASVMRHVSIAAKKHVLLTAQGAALKIEGGDIMLNGPGKIEFKAGRKELSGPKSATLVLPALPKSQSIVDALGSQQFSQQLVAPDVSELSPELVGMPYQIWERGKSIQIASGTFDEEGQTRRVFTADPTELTVIVGDASWEVLFPEGALPSQKGETDE